jgi:hypothetical protein
VDRHRFVADPDPTFHRDADPVPDSDPDWHRNNADPCADPTPSFVNLEIGQNFFLLFLVMPNFIIFMFSTVANVS